MSNENPFMTLERARSVYWLKTNYRPMGELFDNGFLNTRRLEWGAKNAYDPTIKAACQVFLKQKYLPYLLSLSNFLSDLELAYN